MGHEGKHATEILLPVKCPHSRANSVGPKGRARRNVQLLVVEDWPRTAAGWSEVNDA